MHQPPFQVTSPCSGYIFVSSVQRAIGQHCVFKVPGLCSTDYGCQPWLLFWANVAGPFQDYHCPFVSFISCRLMPMSQHCLTPAKESPSVSANSGGRRLLTTLAKQEYRIYKSLRTISNRQLSLPFLSVLDALWDQMKHTDLSNMGTNSKMVPTSPSKHKSFAP